MYKSVYIYIFLVRNVKQSGTVCALVHSLLDAAARWVGKFANCRVRLCTRKGSCMYYTRPAWYISRRVGNAINEYLVGGGRSARWEHCSMTRRAGPPQRAF